MKLSNIINEIRTYICGECNEAQCLEELDTTKTQLITFVSENNTLKNNLLETNNLNKDLEENIKQYTTKVEDLNQELEKYTTIEPEIPDFLETRFEEYTNTDGYIHKGRRFMKNAKGQGRAIYIDARQLFSIGSSRMIEICREIDFQYKPTTKDEMKIACMNWQSKNVKYEFENSKWSFNDYWTYPEEVLLKDWHSKENKYGDDCLPEDTYLLREDMELIKIKDIEIGDKIYGMGNKTTKVLNKWDKGNKKVLKIGLNTGTILECTPEHKIYLINNGKIIEKRASELIKGDELYYEKELKPYKYSDIDYDYLKLIGLFIADGWATTEGKKENKHRGYISGKDGFPKELQKQWVAEWCDKKEIRYSMFKRYIHIMNKDLVKEFLKFGKGALNKHLTKEYLYLQREQIEFLLEGLSADASKYPNKDKGSLVYGTISPKLSIQIRILYRMLGEQMYVRWWSNHGGLGKNPICRLHNRGKVKNTPVYIKNIEEGEVKKVYDIETENKGIYLPEHDVIVHNCESRAFLTASLIHNFSFIRPEFKTAWWEVSAELGFYGTGGHGWVKVYLEKDNKYMIYESTGSIVNLYNEDKAIYNAYYGVYSKHIYIYNKMIFGAKTGVSVGSKASNITNETLRLYQYAKYKNMEMI